ncbi:hypothetical protein [Nocardioides acrostichi]|uniref:Uncharacterized protein n=1 Tax=Nocardioides acrostichi TaxID=2784339 RepID=A0A930YBQ4_9ACTN|nr:hypothetical protein [Nocardioides acrostichi]MBF4160704.1 hypothetical protein [Nocardioides acrostichi]
MEILLWLVPSVVVTLLACCWVGWAGRERREVDREVLLARMAAGMNKETPLRYAAPTPPRDRSTGIAVRRSRAPGAGGSEQRRAS